jgi:hypothetical protein
MPDAAEAKYNAIYILGTCFNWSFQWSFGKFLRTPAKDRRMALLWREGQQPWMPAGADNHFALSTERNVSYTNCYTWFAMN